MHNTVSQCIGQFNHLVSAKMLISIVMSAPCNSFALGGCSTLEADLLTKGHKGLKVDVFTARLMSSKA